MLAAHPSEVYVWETLIIADKWFLRPKPRTAGFRAVVGSGSLWLDDSLVKFSQNEITCSQPYCFLFQNGHTASGPVNFGCCRFFYLLSERDSHNPFFSFSLFSPFL